MVAFLLFVTALVVGCSPSADPTPWGLCGQAGMGQGNPKRASVPHREAYRRTCACIVLRRTEREGRAPDSPAPLADRLPVDPRRGLRIRPLDAAGSEGTRPPSSDALVRRRSRAPPLA